MEKKFVITITKTAVVPMATEFEAQNLAMMMMDRESSETMVGNMMFVTTDVKELENAR